jgi:hypothetical protein
MVYYLFKLRASFFLILLSVYLFSKVAYARVDVDSNDEPPNTGAFALPESQQPGPLISFGQILIGKNAVQLGLGGTETYFPGETLNNTPFSLDYGFTEDTALFFSYARSFNRPTSPLNTSLTLEHSIYYSGTNKYEEEATIVGELLLPLHDGKNEQLLIEDSALGYFLGATYVWMSVDWYWFASPGVTAYRYNPNHVQPGTDFSYQAGLGHNIKSVSDKYIWFGLLELDGDYITKERGFVEDAYNTGGNVIMLTPSFYFSTPHTILQLGVSVPVVQNLNGDQLKSHYAIVAAIYLTIT